MKKIIYMEIITCLARQVALEVKSVVCKFHTMIPMGKIKKLNNDFMTLLFGGVFFNCVKDGDTYSFTNGFAN